MQEAISALSLDRLHIDTTSFVYTGQGSDHLLKIMRGYSKDHRPDLPQIKFGMGTTGQGTSVYGETLDGNQDDKNEMATFRRP